jgi:L-threonylcarbamoyladenylate synthase
VVKEEELKRAAGLIRAGALVAFPTETVYGLGANALDTRAVAEIYAAKGRPRTSPLIVHVASLDMARSLTAAWPDAATRLAERFWPGPLTLVLQKGSPIPDIVTAGLPTVGIRMPAHPVALALIEMADVPIAAPSANRFMEVSPTTAAHVEASLGGQIAAILDDGPTQVGIESTVLSLANADVPVLLRPGMISRAEIEPLIGQVQTAGDISGSHPSPGMHPRHYSPSTPLVLGTEVPRGAAYVWRQKWMPAARDVPMPASPETYAACLYQVLHSLDKEGFSCIVVEPVPDSAEWEGIRDRLERAARRRESK